MFSRRRKVAVVAERPSLTWHLMREEYHPIFVTDSSERIEYWYNKLATQHQRENFRRICKEISQQDPERGLPEMSALYSLQYCICEADSMIRHYGFMFSVLGKKLARLWIMHDASHRDKNTFTELFTGLQTDFIPKSVMKTDFQPPEQGDYEGIDRSHFLSSIDWFNPESKRNLPRVDIQKFGNKIASTRASLPVKKPKNQFDGVSPLAVLGYTGDLDTEIEKLREKQQKSEEAERYYVEDGCTVYVAGRKENRRAATLSKNRVIATFYGD